MPCSKFGHRGFKHGQRHGCGQPCKQRCMLGAMTIPELLNLSNVCRATPPCYNIRKFRRSRNCETYQRECPSSYSDDEPERLETPNNACEYDYECADTRVLVRECQVPPLFERPITCPNRLPCEKPPPYKPSPGLSSTCSNICDDSYIEIPSPNPDPTGQYYSNSLCKKPSLCQGLLISCPDPSVCKAPPSAQIPSMCTTTPSSESLSVVVCDPDEDKVGRRVSFGSVSEQRITPCLKEDLCTLNSVCVIEMPMCAVASTQVSPKPTQSCATQNGLSYTSSVETQSDLCDCKRGSTASLEMDSQTYSESSVTCGAKSCPKSTTAKSKRSNNSSKGKKQKDNKELNSCDAVDCPKSILTRHDCHPCVSPSPSKSPKYKNNIKNKEYPPSVSKSPPLTPSASNEIRSESLHSNKSKVLCTCTYNNEESQSKCDIHKNSNKKSWFRKCKGKTTRKEQQKLIGKSKPQGQNVHIQLLQGAQSPHGQLFPDRQPLQEQIQIPLDQLALGIQTSPEVMSQGVQISVTLKGPFVQREQMPQSQVVSGIQTQPGTITQNAQTSLKNSCTPGGQLPLRQLVLEEQMPSNQFVSEMQSPRRLSSQSSKAPQSQFYSQDQFKRQQYPQSELISGGQLPQSQFAPRGQTTGGYFPPTGQTSQGEFPEGQYPRGQFTPDGQNVMGLSSPGQVPQRQFASEEKYPENQLTQIPQNEFVPPRHIPQSPFIPGGQNLQSQFAPGRIPDGGSLPGGYVPQSQLTSDGHYNQGFPQNQHITNDQTVSSNFIPDRKFGENMPIFPKEQIISGQFAAGGQNTQLPSTGQIAQSHFEGTAPQSLFNTKPFNKGGGSLPYSSPDPFLLVKKPLHLQEQGQCHPERPEQFAPRGPIPPIQSVSGGQRLSRQPPLGSQMAPSQLVSELLHGQISSEDSNRQKLASEVGTPPDQFVLGSLDKADQGERRPHPGMIDKPHLSGQIPPTEMSSLLQDQVQSPRDLGLIFSGSPIPPGQSNTGNQIPLRQAPLGGQMPPHQSISGGLTPTAALFSGGQLPSNKYTPTELPQDQISSELLNKQQLASQVGTPPDQLDLRSLNKTDLGAPRDQNWNGIICPLCGFEGKIIATNISSCNSLKTVCSCVKITCNCLTPECRDKFKCTCCCNNEDKAPKNCQYACVQCTETGQISPTQSVSGSKISSYPYVSAGMLPGQFCPGNLGRLDQKVETGKPPNEAALQCLDGKDRILLTPYDNANTDIDITCSCSILDGRDKNTCKNKKSSKNCQHACVQCKRRWYVQNLIVNTSLYEFQHTNTVLTETPKITDNLSATPKNEACCECHYPPVFSHFQCSGNMCGICTCGETQNE